MNPKCSLCGSGSALFFEDPKKTYFRCGQCRAIFLDPGCYVSREDEQRRYEEHNNDVDDPGYQAFVDPIVKGIQERFGPGHKGLDFGAGTGPVITKLLRDRGFQVDMYDPFFFNDTRKLERTYDFIACCEVMEHFHDPAREFARLKSLLNPGGELFCMTHIYTETTPFKNWYYKNDPTHVIFYHRDTLDWIRDHYGFSGMESGERLVRFSVGSREET